MMKGELASVETLGLMDGSKLEVEVYFTIEVAVDGVGNNYRENLEVSPEEKMESILSRVGFCKMFLGRGHKLFSAELDRQFEAEELQTILFRDSNLKNNSKLILRKPPKHKSPVVSDDEEGEEEMSVADEGFEGGEDELEDMDEEGEAEM